MTTNCPSVRLPLLKALSKKSSTSSSSSSKTSAPGGGTSSRGTTTTSRGSSKEDKAAARRILRWYRRRKRTRRGQSSSGRKRHHDDDDDDDEQPESRNKKRPKLQDITINESSSSSSSQSSQYSKQQNNVTIRLLQSSPAVIERRYAAQWLLNEALVDNYSIVCLKQELRNLVLNYTNSNSQQQHNQQYHVVEWMAVWKELLLSSSSSSSSSGMSGGVVSTSIISAAATGTTATGAVVSNHNANINNNTNSHIVAVCRSDYDFVTKQMLHFIANKQIVAASACADFLRHVILLATTTTTNTNSDNNNVTTSSTTAAPEGDTGNHGGSGNCGGDNIDSSADNKNNDNDEKKESDNNHNATTSPGPLKVVQWRNQHWLWRKNLETSTTSSNTAATAIDNKGDWEDSNNNSSSSSLLSPLACLVASHYALQDKNNTAGLRGSDKLRSLLQLMVDPNRRVVTKKKINNTNSTTKPSSSSSKKSESQHRKEEEGTAGEHGDDNDNNEAPPALLSHRDSASYRHHHRSVLEQTTTTTTTTGGGSGGGGGGDEHQHHGDDDDEDDEDLESIDSDDEDDDDEEEGHGTPTHDDDEDEEEAEDNEHNQQAKGSNDHHDDVYMPDLDAAAEDDQHQAGEGGEGCGCNDEEDGDEDNEEGHHHGGVVGGEDDAENNNEDGENDNEGGGEGEECDCEDEEDEDDDDDCEDDEDEECDDEDDGVEPMEIELSELEQAVSAAGGGSSPRNKAKDKDNKNAPPLSPPLEQRKRLIIRASMQVLEAHYPHHHHHSHNSQSNPSSPVSITSGRHNQQQPHHHHSSRRSDLLTLYSESALIEGINAIIKPPKKPVHTKIILRRAPTQEEFFRGSLSRNPITLHQLRASNSSQQGEHAASSSYEPTVDDLRRHIARDLQMEDSAELLEVLVANQILDPSLKLRVVHQVVWRNHLMENHPAANSGSSLSSLVSHSGLAMIFSSGLPERLISGSSGGGGRASITADTPLSQIPAMVATYRLAGVDGEATEDTVSTLVDPEALLDAKTPEEQEKMLEEEYGLTKLVTVRGGNKSGIPILLRAIQHSIGDNLRRIRRDNVETALNGSSNNGSDVDNLSRAAFAKQPPCAGLALLRHCCQLSSNRKLLLQARAPTVLLKLLLDVLKVMEDNSTSKKNPTAEILQELIEVLSSDISTNDTATGGDETLEAGYGSDSPQDASSMPLLLESIETISLSPPLRHVIAKLLPFLTYGQSDLSRTLAQHFDRNICVESLGVCEQLQEQQGGNDEEGDTIMTSLDDKKRVLMNTFVETAISLPPNQVCNTLRVELITVGLVDRLTRYVSKDMPKQPPSWSPALWDSATTSPTKAAITGSSNKKKRPRRSVKNNNNNNTIDKAALDEAWRDYFSRNGLRTALKILTGLTRKHIPTQSRIASATADFVRCCHWLESTSDNNAANISTTGLGLLAETLLDEMMEGGNDGVVKLIKSTREKTRNRKKELAEERRNQALLKMGSFRPGAVSTSTGSSSTAVATQQGQQEASAVRGAIDAVLGLFSNSPSESSSARASTSRSAKGKDKDNKPSWLAEMEAMEEENGLTCAVCQEGRTIQPSELLGLYAYVKRVSIPFEQCGSRAGIEGITLLKALPSTMPDTLVGDPVLEEWYIVGKAAADNLSSSSLETLSASSKNAVFTSTVSAGNAIHFSCHRTARQADRNHPKAPKSEWEGAVLRNSRVQCNVILPLVSSRSSKVPLIAVETALTEHQAAVSNLLGAAPKSMLWQVLHDVRLMVLRMAYGEALNSDCGGGSLASNCQLVFYQLILANTFDKDAMVDQPSQSQHARGLSAAFLAACSIVSVKGSSDPPGSLMRGISDAAVMASLNSIVFHNTRENEGSASVQGDLPHPKRLWLIGKDFFLRGLLICGGRRHALGLEGSGCQLSSRRPRSATLSEWEVVESNDDSTVERGVLSRSSSGNRAGASARRLSIDDFQNAMRPWLTMYAIMDQISANFTLNMDDVQIEESAERLVQTIEECRQAKNIHELLEKAKITFDHEEMIDLLQKGMISA